MKQLMLNGKVKDLGIKTIFTIYGDKSFRCNYCLYKGKLTDFHMRLKGGKISEKRFKCPYCGSILNQKTLFKKMSIEEFAEWIFMMSLYDFDKRIQWQTIINRLKEMNISYQFWKHYKEIKKQIKGEEEEEYSEEKQKKYFEEKEKWANG